MTTNAGFLSAIFTGLRPDESLWNTAFAVNPEKANGKEWAGNSLDPGNCQDYPHGNAYFSVSTVKPVGNILARRKENFSRLFVVVLDDVVDCDLMPTYRILTSENSNHIGFALSEPLDDVEVATRLHEQLNIGGRIKADKNGNNPVRYVRLPNQINTKYSPAFAGRLEFFEPGIRHTLPDLIETLGLDAEYILNGAERPLGEDESNAAKDSTYQPDNELIRLIQTAESYHDPLLILTARYAKRGMSEKAIIETVQGFMRTVEDRSERWNNRFNDIVRITRDGIKKFADKTDSETLKHISEVKVWSAESAGATAPARLDTMPGRILNLSLEWLERSAEDTNHTLNVSSVIHLAACATSRCVESSKNNHAALYIGQIARTGEGKNCGKNGVSRVLTEAMRQPVSANFSSASSIFSALRSTASAVFHLDEFGDKLRHGLNDRGHVAAGFDFLKEVYSQTHSTLHPSAFSMIGLSAANREKFLIDNGPIVNPHLNLLAITTPGQFHDAVTGAMVEGGMLNRFVFVEACGKLIQNDDAFDPNPPMWLIEHIQQLRNDCGSESGGNMAGLILSNPDLKPHLTRFSFDGESNHLLREFKDEIRQLGRSDDFFADMSRRWRENAMRMALALHAFNDHKNLTIPIEITSWCIDYMRYHGQRFVRKLYEMASPSETYGKRRQAYLAAFRGKPSGVGSNDLGKYAPWRNDHPTLRVQIINDMLASRDIARVLGEKPIRGPVPKLYVALP